MIRFILRTFIIIVVSGLLFIRVADAQVLPENSPEQKGDSTDHRYKRVNKYLDINLNNEKSMFKISPEYFLSSRYKGFGFNLAYEMKLNQSFSFSVLNRIGGSFYEYSNWNSGTVVVEKQKSFSNSTGFGFRYYYLMNRRIKEGISGNNLNGLYFGANFNGLLNLYNKEVEERYNKTYVMDKYKLPQFIDLPDPSIYIGFQKRINSWAFFDVYINSGYNQQFDYFFGGVGFQIGVAL